MSKLYADLVERVQMVIAPFVAKADLDIELYNAAGGKSTAIVKFGKGTEGPPGRVHGGAIFTVADFLLAYHTNHNQGCLCFTAHQDIDYRGAVNLGETVRFDAWIDKVDDRGKMRKLTVRFEGKVEGQSKVCAEGTGLWIAKVGQAPGTKVISTSRL
eukprot:Hpha_TRINITY_DN37302_c0_g1::TRINITY_DN37302_c0_g1_i1::g.103734::m.103734